MKYITSKSSLSKICLFITLKFCLLSVPTAVASDAGEWQSLFNGKDLNGWKILGGKHKFYVENNEIVGEAVRGAGNTFLCKGPYHNFELHLEVKLDGLSNSGIQIRSALGTFKHRSGKMKPCVMGPQIEITPNNSGAIFGEHCGKDNNHRGWISGRNIVKTAEEKKAFKADQWNHIKIVANGNSMKIWVNGVPTTDCNDAATNKEGLIGLQVHMSGRDGSKVRFRNIKIRKLPAQ